MRLLGIEQPDVWLPKLAEKIAETDAFILQIGPNGIGPWQAIEYEENANYFYGRERETQTTLVVIDACATTNLVKVCTAGVLN